MASEASYDEMSFEEAPMAAPEMMESFSAEGEFRDSAKSSFSDASVDEVTRIVIKNADITIVVSDPSESMDNIVKMTNDKGGFVVSSRLYKIWTENGIEVPEASMTIRVPAESLDDALNEIKSLVNDPLNDILNESVSGEDVTKEYTDLNSRLKNLEQAQEQLQEIMASATKTEDVLAVYNQLKSVGEEIEIIKGQIKYYEEAAALSAINIQIRSTESVQPLTIGKWQPVGVAKDALQALINVLKFLVNALIWIIILFVPVIIILILPIWIIVRLIKRRKNKKKDRTEELNKDKK